MTSKERLLAALTGTMPDRLPVTTHHVMPYFLQKCLQGIPEQEFFDKFGLDAITWSVPHRPGPGQETISIRCKGSPAFLRAAGWRTIPGASLPKTPAAAAAN